MSASTKHCQTCGKPLSYRNRVGYCVAHIVAQRNLRDKDMAAAFKSGETIEHIAERHGFHIATIKRILRDQGVLYRPISRDPFFSSRAIKIVATEIGSNPEEIKSAARPRRLVTARWAVMTALHEQGVSKNAIGRRIGRDHTTVMHGIRQAELLAKRDPSFAALVEKARTA